ncbi:MAG: DinB family protein [Vicinamibacterales bacterium]
MADTQPEAWLRGAIDGYDPLLMPVVHSLIQAREDVERLVGSVAPEQVWATPGGAASVGFHVRHLGGALDRLFTYARGEALGDAQKAFLRGEGQPGDPPATLEQLSMELNATIDQAFARLRGLTKDELLQPRAVGRAALPSTTLGLLFHAAEHCTRHAGQAITTAKILAGK